MLAKLDNAEFCIKDDSLKFVTGARITLDLYILGSDNAYITESMQEITNKKTTSFLAEERDAGTTNDQSFGKVL